MKNSIRLPLFSLVGARACAPIVAHAAQPRIVEAERDPFTEIVRRRVLPGLFTLAILLGAVPLSLSSGDPVRGLHCDIEYGRAGDDRLLLDAWVPEHAGPFPVAILVHGGGWTGGDKAGDIALLLEPLTAAGFTCFSINYRLAPQHRWPACLDDVLTAIRWARAHADEFKGDPGRIALLGYSAGGHLVCFAGTVVDETVRVQAVVGFAPLTDFVQELPKRGNILGHAQRGLLNRPEELTPESLGMLHALSPINHVRPGLPPFLLLHGDADGSVPYEQSIAFQAKLEANGVRSELLTLPGASHKLAEWGRSVPDYTARLIAWLRSTLDGTTANTTAPR